MLRELADHFEIGCLNCLNRRRKFRSLLYFTQIFTDVRMFVSGGKTRITTSLSETIYTRFADVEALLGSNTPGKMIAWLRIITQSVVSSIHDDVIKWKHFPRYWPFVQGIHRSPVNSPHKGQWRGALMFSLICVWINGWANNREAGDLRRCQAHYDVTIMKKNPNIILFARVIWWSYHKRDKPDLQVNSFSRPMEGLYENIVSSE